MEWDSIGALNRLSDKMDYKRIIKTKAPKAEKNGCKPAGWELELPNNFPDNLAGLIERIGVHAVYNAAIASLIIMFQGEVRRLAEAGISDDKIARTMSGWMPGQSTAGVSDPIVQARRALSKLSPEDKGKLLEMLKNRPGGIV